MYIRLDCKKDCVYTIRCLASKFNKVYICPECLGLYASANLDGFEFYAKEFVLPCSIMSQESSEYLQCKWQAQMYSNLRYPFYRITVRTCASAETRLARCFTCTNKLRKNNPFSTIAEGANPIA